MYTIQDYNEQVELVKNEIGTLRDIVDEFIERWQNVSSSIDELETNIDDIPQE